MTLLESLVVVALTALLSALAFPTLTRSARLLGYQEARVRLVADAGQARARAITSGRETGLTVAANGAGYVDADGAGVALPGGLRLATPDGGPRFRPDGTAAGGPLLLDGAGFRAAILIDPATGLANAGGR